MRNVSSLASRLTSLLLTLGVLTGCATAVSQLQGTSGHVAWRVEDLRLHDDREKNTRTWYYTLILRDTKGIGTTFEHAQTGVNFGSHHLGTQEERLSFRLEPFAEVRVNLFNGFGVRDWGSSFLRSERLAVSRIFSGTTDHGQRVRVSLSYYFDSTAPAMTTTAASTKAMAHLNVANEAMKLGKLREAEAELLGALNLNRDPETRSAVLVGLSGVLLGRGQLNAARARAEEAISLTKDPQLRAAVSVLLGTLLLAQGQIAAAEERLREASLVVHPDIRAGGLLGLAELRLIKIRERFRREFASPPIAVPVSISSRWFKELLTEALRGALRRYPDEIRALGAMYEEARTSAQDRSIRAAAAASLGQLKVLTGEIAAARQLLEMALKEAPSDFARVAARAGLGLAAFLEGDYAVAIRECDQALAPFIQERSNALPIGVLQLKALALMLWTLEAPSDAERKRLAQEAGQALRLAMEAVDENRAGIEAPQGRIAYVASHQVQDLFDSAAFFSVWLHALKEGNPADGFEVVERGRARTLLEQLARRKGGIAELPPPLREKERTLATKVAELQQALTIPRPYADTLRDDLGSAQRALKAFADSLRAHSHPNIRTYAALKYPRPPKADEIQRALREDEVLIEFKITPGASRLWILRKQGPVRMFDIHVEGKKLRDQVTALLDAISRGPGTAFDPVPARGLYDLLLKDALADIRKGASLILIPDDVLHLLPFEVLVTDIREASVSYLGEKYLVRYYPSGAALALSRNVPAPKPQWTFPLFAIADPLGYVEPSPAVGPQSQIPGHKVRHRTAYLAEATARGYRFARLPATRREVTEIAATLRLSPTRPHVLIGDDAVKTRLLDREKGEELWRYRFIHLATHGILGTDVSPMNQPALILSPQADESSAFLTMDEIAELRLTADLVVLSACQTGRGEEVPGEGVLGLTRAVLQAGAASVVVSLWNVADDATATFMARFYSYLVKDGFDKARALQKAKLDFIREARGSAPQGHPFFWASFILVGEDTSVGAGVSPEAPLETKSSEERVKADVDTLTPPGPPVFKSDDGAEMVLVPAGEFWMGSAEEEVARAVEDCKKLGRAESICRSQFENELPRHRVALDAFYIDRYEVTNALFERFVDATKHRTTAELDGKGRSEQIRDGKWQLVTIDGASWRTPNGPGTTANPTHPVVQISWDDALAYCKWAGRRLPTEAEWEKAARGNDGRRYPWGDSWDRGKANAARSANGTTPVGSYPAGASPFGVHDMAGNVWEWVSDWHSVDYYKVSPERNPQGPETARWKALRGGSSLSAAVYSRTARRGNREPDFLADYIGFRCARDARPDITMPPQPTKHVDLAVTRRAAPSSEPPPGGGIGATSAAPGWSNWMSGKEYQAAFDIKFREGFYPARVEGAQTLEGARFRAAFEALPAGAYFYSYFGLAEDRFAKRNAELASVGFHLIWTQTFVDANGQIRYQATWIK